MEFSPRRMRRLRRTPTLRALVRETTLDPGDFVLPLFVRTGEGVRREVLSMPGVFQMSADVIVEDSREAMTEIALDIEEGADMIMIKPAMPCLDIIREARDRFDLPIAAYQVSGEYAMMHAAARNGWLDLDTVMMESLTAIRRAGADMIITYFARRAAGLLG
jgi:delta-aminolevulinic acid dehydratase/porphobilinogen synthase